MKELRKKVFAILAKMEGRKEKNEIKNNNSLKELKLGVSVALTLMQEVCNCRFGRNSSFKRLDINKYKDMAYYVAHSYRKRLVFKDNFETEKVFDQMVEAGFEGIVQGFSKFDGTKKAKLSTFLFNRVKYAVSKYVQKLIRDKKKQTISLNLNVGENTELEEVFRMELPNIEEVVERSVEKDALLRVMNKLPEFERTVLQLYSTNSLTSTAKKTNLTIQNVKNILSSMRPKIEAELRDML